MLRTIQRRLFSSNKLNCSDCRLYDKNTKLCKFNNLNAFENRLDDIKCGPNAINFMYLDKSKLVKSDIYISHSTIYSFFTVGTLLCALFAESGKCALFSIISYIISDSYEKEGLKCRNEYLTDNNLDKDQIDNIKKD